MAKDKKKPAPKKAEPVAKKKVAKAKTPKKEAPKKVAKKQSFPECEHLETKRTLGPRNRVLHVCTSCGKVIRVGGR